MLNSYSKQNINIDNTLNINACSGGIYKTYPKTFMCRFHLQSKLANSLLGPNPIYNFSTNEYESKWKEVVILQMVICGDMEVMAEIITKEDFDKILKDEEENKKC